MIKATLLLLIPFIAFADCWLVGGQLLSSGGGGGSIDPNAPLILNHDAAQPNEAVNLRTVKERVFGATPLSATSGVVWVDFATGYNQWHEATGEVTFVLGPRSDTNTYESFLLHVLALDATLSFATNHIDVASLSRLNIASNQLFSFRLVGPAGQANWFVTEDYASMVLVDPDAGLIAGLSDGLIFYAPFEDSAHDTTGTQQLRGTNTTDGSPIGYISGVVGQAVVFQATNRTYFSYTNSPVSADAPLWANGTGFTVSWWEHKLDIEGDYIDVVLIGPLDGTGPFHDTFSIFENQEISFIHYANDEYIAGRGPYQWWLDYTPPADVWVHMVFTYDPEGVAMVYVNGSFYESASQTLGDASSGHFTVGNLYQYPHWTYNGYLDELAMWNRVLSPEEVSALYNDGTGQALSP